MSDSANSPAQDLHTFLLGQLHDVAAKLGFCNDNTHLLRGLSGCSADDHHDALGALVRSGVIDDYRYIDQGPHPVIVVKRP